MAGRALYRIKPNHEILRAKSLLEVGKPDEALTRLYNFLTKNVKKSTAWERPHEELMNMFIDLCIQQQDSRRARKGIEQYRNMTQNTQPTSLRRVIERLLSSGLEKTRKARVDSNAAVEELADEDEEESPESILMSTVAADGSAERTSREILLPWISFMRFTFMNILEALKTCYPVYKLYHETAVKAFDFCAEFARKDEFRRVSHKLRDHVDDALSAMREHGRPEDMEELHALYISTRLHQLQTAMRLSMWSDAFRICGELDAFAAKSSKALTSQQQLEYYNALGVVFSKAGNHLYHAYARFKYFELSSEMEASQENMRSAATSLLLAALAIPIKAVDDRPEESILTSHLAQLLNLNALPSRQSLLRELQIRNVFQLANKSAQVLFTTLENEFCPLQLVDRVATILRELREGESGEELQHYAQELQELVIIRLFQQLSRVYKTVTIAHLQQLVEGLSFTFAEIERLVAQYTRAGLISVRIDHAGGVFHLGTHTMQSDEVRLQLAELAKGLFACVQRINAAAGVVDDSDVQQRQKVFDEAREEAKTSIEYYRSRRGELFERQQKQDRQRKALENAMKAAGDVDEIAKKTVAQNEEAIALAEEERKKKEEEDAQLRQENEEKRKILGELGRSVKDITEEDVTELSLSQLKHQLREKQHDEEMTLRKRQAEAARRLDYLTRALRMEETKKLKSVLPNRVEEDKQYFEASRATYEQLRSRRLELFRNLEERKHLFDAYRGQYLQQLMAERTEQFKLKLRDFYLDINSRLRSAVEVAEELQRRNAEQKELEAAREITVTAAAPAAPEEETVPKPYHPTHIQRNNSDDTRRHRSSNANANVTAAPPAVPPRRRFHGSANV